MRAVHRRGLHGLRLKDVADEAGVIPAAVPSVGFGSGVVAVGDGERLVEDRHNFAGLVGRRRAGRCDATWVRLKWTADVVSHPVGSGATRARAPMPHPC